MRTTVTLNDEVYQALKVRAAESGSTMSALVEEAIKYQLLEDADDIETAQKRQNEPTISYDELVKKFKKQGLL